MRTIHDPIKILQKELESWDTPFVELDCFGTDCAEQIAEMLDEFCRAHLGSKLHGYLFYRSGIGSTHGIQLEDGRDVVIKIRPPAEANPNLNFDRTSLESICRVMKWLTDRGYPCPKPILGPTSLAKGLATVEEFLDRGEHANGFEDECRKLIATGLAELIRLLRSFEGEISCLKYFQRSESLYPQPHSRLFDFEKTAAGAGWIDNFAERARQAEAYENKPVLGHGDWRVEHLGFREGKIVATYDWDSLAFCTETELVGVSAHGFTADWTLEAVRRIPTANDIHAYVADYERARGQLFSKLERKSLFAHCVYCIAYSARCAHSFEPDKMEWEEDTWPYLLKTEGEALLREAQP